MMLSSDHTDLRCSSMSSKVLIQKAQSKSESAPAPELEAGAEGILGDC